MPVISYTYTQYFGEDIFYTADVYKKEKNHYSGRSSRTHYYVEISSNEFGIETLDNRELYENVNISSKISITKRESFLGSYIYNNKIGILIK